MNPFKALIFAALVCVMTFGWACSKADEDQAKDTAQKIEDKTKEVAGDVADKGKELVSATGEAITDGWITTKIRAKFIDEKLLKESDITVDTNDRVVTLKGTVASSEAKKRAVMIAGGTEGVLKVDDKIVLKAK